MFAAFARLDPDEFAGHLTEEVDFRPSAFVTGIAEFHGREAVRENLAELKRMLAETGEKVRLRPQRFFVDREDEDRILALAQLTIIRANGEAFGSEAAYLHVMEGEKVRELRTWLDHEEGLRQLADPEEVASPS